MMGPQLTTRYSTVDSASSACRQCATSLASDARFCFECGAKVATPRAFTAIPEPLEEPADTIPLAVEDLEEIRCGEILEIESCIRADKPQARPEPDLVDLAFCDAAEPRRSPSSAHTQVVGAVCLEIDTDLDESELDPARDLVGPDAEARDIEAAGSFELDADADGGPDEVEVDMEEFDEPASAPPGPPHVDEGTVVAMTPGPSLPYWPAPARGETVIATAPPEPPPGYARWSA